MENKNPSKRITMWLYGLVFALNLFGFAARVIEKLLGYNDSVFVRFFDVSEEANITSWFSSLLLLFSALLLYIIARFKLRETDSFARHWAILSVVFLYLSMDETAKIHEAMIKPLRQIFNASGIFYYSWVIIGIPLVLLLAVFYMRFMFSLQSSIRNQFLLAAILFLSGALGLEMLGGLFFNTEIFGVYISSFLVTAEELLENLGVVVFISALINYIKLRPDWKSVPMEFI